jgi:zinc protease
MVVIYKQSFETLAAIWLQFWSRDGLRGYKERLMIEFCSKRFAVTIWLICAFALTVLPANAAAENSQLTHFQLSNGLDVFVKEDHSRKVAALQMWVMVGSTYENDSERGISHVIEHMAFKGTTTRGVGKIAEEIEEIGGEINAYTSWDETVFHIVVPSPEVARGLDILTDAVFRPSIDAQELEKEKKVVIEEILQGEDRPDDVISKLLFKTAYIKSPYQYPIIGYQDIVEKTTRENILDFRKRWYVPENMFLMVVGDVNPADVRREVEKFTSDIKQTGFFKIPLAQEPPQEKIRSAVIKDRNARETRLNIAFHIPSMKSNDVNALDLAADALGAREDSRLVRILKKEKGLVNSISAYSLTPKEPGLMVISATLDAKNLDAATRGVMEELARLADTPPSQDELQQAKTHIESEHLNARETVQGAARNMGTFQNELYDADYGEKYLTLNSVVTPQQVSAAVKKYLVPPNVTITVLLPEDAGEGFRMESLEKIVSGFEPKAKTGPAAGIASATLSRELDNGIKVVLVPDDSNPLISFRIASLGGKRFETEETQGIMNFIARMLTKGAGSMTEFDIARKVDNMGGSLEGFSGFDSFGLYGSFFSRYADQALELLCLLYTDPSFAQDKMDRERELIINDIKTEPDEPTKYAINALYETVFPTYPYGFDKLGTLATVSGFNADELKQTYRRFAVSSNTVITAVGSMDPEKVFDRINQLFGKLPKRQLDMPQIPAQDALEKVREKVIHMPRAQAHLAIGFSATTFSEPDRYPLDVLSNLLAGQGGRLFRELRDKESLAYTVTAFFRPGLAPGIFGFYMACDAPKADRASKGLVEEIERVQKAKVSDAEVKKAITNLIGNHLITLQSSSERAENMGLNTLYGLGYDYDSVYLQKIREVTVSDVLRVARKYLDLKHSAVVKILPEEGGGKANRTVK